MPTKAARPCSNRACNGLVRNGVCSVCGPVRQYRDRAHDANRGTAAERGYDHTWRKLRRMQLAEHPLCHDCKQQGILTAGVDVHHIRAVRDGGTNELDNLMTLCKPCHSKRTNRGE